MVKLKTEFVSNQQVDISVCQIWKENYILIKIAYLIVKKGEDYLFAFNKKNTNLISTSEASFKCMILCIYHLYQSQI